MKRLYLGKIANRMYELGTAKKGWHPGSGFLSKKLVQGFCPYQFERYVTVKRKGKVIKLNRGEFAKVKSITFEVE